MTEFQETIADYRRRIAAAERAHEFALAAYLKREMWNYRDAQLARIIHTPQTPEPNPRQRKTS